MYESLAHTLSLTMEESNQHNKQTNETENQLMPTTMVPTISLQRIPLNIEEVEIQTH
jgi:hypothetical protein